MRANSFLGLEVVPTHDASIHPNRTWLQRERTLGRGLMLQIEVRREANEAQHGRDRDSEYCREYAHSDV
jgi:hypothetical protein